MRKMYKIDFEVKPNDEYYLMAKDLDEAKEIAKRIIHETPFDCVNIRIADVKEDDRWEGHVYNIEERGHKDGR